MSSQNIESICSFHSKKGMPLNLMRKKPKSSLKRWLKLPHLRKDGQFFKKLRTLGIVTWAVLTSGCIGLPTPPQTSLCSFDNSSKDDGSDKSPNFKCINSKETRFKIRWNSESADKMICSPYEDYLETQEFYKKVFKIFETEVLSKARGG